MKILCLHGHGTSSKIFETQLTAIREELGDSYDYVHVDGSVESGPVEALGDMVPGPFFGWFSGFSPAKISDSHSLVEEIIEEDGHFDGIFGFSQGATLALCYLLQHGINHPHERAPVKFAVLFSCAGPAFSPDMDINASLIGGLSAEGDFEALERLARDGKALPTTEGDSPKETLLSTMAAALRLGERNGFVTPALAIQQWRRSTPREREQTMTRVFHPRLTAARVKIPTVHVLGRNDTEEVAAQAELCWQLCDSGSASWVTHSVGHDVPRKVEDVRQVAAVIKSVAQEAVLMAC